MNAERKIQKSSFWANLFKTTANFNDLYGIIKNTPLFENLGRSNFKHLYALLNHRSYKSNEYVFHQGDPGNAFYIIVEGSIKIIQTSEENKEILSTELHRGDFLGELALIEDDIRPASAVALSNSKLAVIFKSDLDSFMKKYPLAGVEIMRNLSHILSTRLKNLNTDFTELLDKCNNMERN
ncbi:MAG: cyclic nucleotide-binding domain-containing protein [Bacteroidota bacterium]